MSMLGINHQQVSNASDKLETQAGQLDTLNAALEQLQTAVKGVWESEEAVAFDTGYDKLQKTMNEMSTVIRSISKWAAETQSNYKTNENKGTQFYNSIF